MRDSATLLSFAQRSFSSESAKTLRKPRNADVRPREFLTEREVEALVKAAGKAGRYGHRDATLLLVLYRHGLRVSEAARLRWDDIDLNGGRMHVRRLKRGVDSTHPVSGRELRALRKLQRAAETPFVFETERRSPITPASIHRVVVRAGELAELPFPVHAHMLRHGCGYALANAGHDTRAVQHYLGHRNIQHTVRYTELAANRFNGFWKD